MRWQFCAQPPDRNLLFGFGPGQEIKRRLLTLWNSARFLVDYATIEGFRPEYGAAPPAERPLDRWLAARTEQLVAEATAGYDAFLTVNVTRAFEEFVDDVSNWYIRRSRRRFWDGDDGGAAGALARARAGDPRRRAGDAVPRRASLAEPRARRRRRAAAVGAPRRLARARHGPTQALLDEVAELRRVVGARPSGSRGRPAEAPPAAAAARRRGRAARRGPRGGAARGAARQGGRVRPRRGDRAAREAAPAGARPEARQGARRGPGRARRGRVRAARRRRLPGARPRPRRGRGARRALGQVGLGGRVGRGRDRRARHGASIPSSSSRAASTT